MKLKKDSSPWVIILSSFLAAVVIYLFLLVFCGNVYSADTDVCFDPPTAGNMVVELEKARIMEKENILLREGNNELERQIGLLKQVTELKDKQIDVLEKTNKEYEDLLKTQKDLYSEMLKHAKPSIFSQLRDALGFVGIGALLMLVL
jgi:hypothetical protein